MLRGWLDRSDAAKPPAAVPDGLRIYAVGDIHGRADLLATMAGLVAADIADRPAASATTVFLGDYVDRGSASSAVIERLATADFPTPIVALRGNHDAILLDLLDAKFDHAAYARLGGEATLTSYGIDKDVFALATTAERIALLAAALPAHHRAFLEALHSSITFGDYFFCHAGVRPGISLDRQSDEDLMWIREEFLTSRIDFGKVVVHGHTPVRRPLVRANGIDIDTQAFATGVLTAIVLEGTGRRFLQTQARS